MKNEVVSSKQILFVDPQPPNRRSVSSRFIAVNPDWQFSVALNRAHALRLAEKVDFDAVIMVIGSAADEGVPTLGEIMALRPRALRYVILEIEHWPTAVRYLGLAHRFLVSPCDPPTLRSALDRGFAYETWLPTERVCRMLAKLQRVPSPPTLYYEVVRELQSPSASLEVVGSQIARDPAMTAKLLQVVNSAVFGLGRQVVNPSEAVLYLGAESTKALILLAHSFSAFEELRDSDFSVEELWRHSLATANFARRIAQVEGMEVNLVEEAFTAGILHDLGKLALAANAGSTYREAVCRASESEIPLWQAEQEVLGANHAEIGACLLAIWGLPATLVEALALHHHPVQLISHGFCSLAAVHAANAMEHRLRGHATEAVIDQNYLQALNKVDRCAEWEKVCRSEPASNA